MEAVLMLVVMLPVWFKQEDLQRRMPSGTMCYSHWSNKEFSYCKTFLKNILAALPISVYLPEKKWSVPLWIYLQELGPKVSLFETDW